MNPYDEPLAQLAPLSEDIQSKRIRWLAILICGLVYFGGSSVLQFFLREWYEISVTTTSQALLAVVFLVPWVLGASLLAWFARSRWVMHGMIFSMIPPLITFISCLYYTGFYLILFPFFALWYVQSLASALVAMGVTRLILGMKLRNQTHARPASNQILNEQ